MGQKRLKRLLVTGAAGGIGKAIRTKLAPLAEIVRLSDRAGLGEAASHEEIVYCELTDKDSVDKMVAGCDGIVHLGGQSVEADWDTVRDSNIEGLYHLYEAASKHKIGRIFFASSNHVIGFHNRETLLDAQSEMRPDSLYGVSKGFGELLAQYYFDKFAIESALVRIGSCFPKPLNRRMLSTWLSEGDLAELIKKVYAADRLGCTVVYGVSDNPSTWWDNKHAKFLGWTPKDSSEVFEKEGYLLEENIDSNDPAVRFQGGPFAKAGHFEDN